jgi:hypothetical protein
VLQNRGRFDKRIIIRGSSALRPLGGSYTPEVKPCTKQTINVLGVRNPLLIYIRLFVAAWQEEEADERRATYTKKRIWSLQQEQSTGTACFLAAVCAPTNIISAWSCSLCVLIVAAYFWLHAWYAISLGLLPFIRATPTAQDMQKPDLRSR